jgi:hypothetical protein
VKLPRITISCLLLVIAVLAIDMAALVQLQRGRSWGAWETQVLLTILPPINVLVLGLWWLGRQLALPGECAPFLVGFEAAGWTAVAAALIARLGFNNQMSLYHIRADSTLWAIWYACIEWRRGFTFDHADGIRVGFHVLSFAGPLLLAAVWGGWIAQVLGVSVVRGTTAVRRPRALPLRRAFSVLITCALVLGAGIWAAKVRGRWLSYRATADGAIRGGATERRQYEEALAQLQSLDEHPDVMADDPQWRAGLRKDLLEAIETNGREMERAAVRQKVYESAARHPWLPIPPNPPLNPWAEKVDANDPSE